MRFKLIHAFLGIFILSLAFSSQETQAQERDASFLPPATMEGPAVVQPELSPDLTQPPPFVKPQDEKKTDEVKPEEANKSDVEQEFKRDSGQPAPSAASPVVSTPPVALAPSSPAATPNLPSPPAAEKAPDQPSSVAPVPMPQPVVQAPLASVDPETFGLLSPEHGGLGSSVWGNTSRLVVDRLLPVVRLPSASMTLNDLARRLFLSSAAAPILAPSDEKPTRTLLSGRLEGLLALGAVDQAWELSLLADPSLVDAVTLRQLAEASLISPNSKTVCDKIPSLMAAHGTKEEAQLEWQKALLICQLKAGQKEQVQLGLDVMQENKGAARDTFAVLLSRNILGDKKVLPTNLTPLRPTTLALLEESKLALPPELYIRAEASMVPGLIQTKAQKESARLDMAERMAAKGVLTKDQLLQAYKSYEPSSQEVASANSTRTTTSVDRAMMLRAIENEGLPDKKMDMALRFLNSLPPQGQIGPAGQIVADLLADILPKSDYNRVSAGMTRLYAMAGQPDKAMLWHKIARDVAGRSPDVADELKRIWPLLVLSGLVSDGDYPQEIKAWLDATLVGGGDDGKVLHAQRELAGRTLLLFLAADYVVPDDGWNRVVEGQSSAKEMTPSPVLLERLRQAAHAGRRGEVVLLSLLLMGVEPQDAPYGVKVEIVRALRMVGLRMEMQALARELMVGL
ncbi:MAG: hypothetical protein EOM37_08560 [Proteobacteria bacterium]|jgi:hypothetical protein|nr:hypothetical protein [Alphaproteobacteria bacterium]NCC04078.1 hypothetical protein [Pseudomonadota bacterium]